MRLTSGLMRKTSWMIPVLLLFAAIGAPAGARADTVYDVVTTIGEITLSGTITTDGTIGQIVPCEAFPAGDITVAGDGSDAPFTLVTNNVGCTQTGPSAWTATATDITFNTDDGTSSTVFQDLTTGDSVEFYSALDPGGVLVLYADGDTVSAAGSGELEFATTPEPGTRTLTLVGIGLVGLASVMRKRKARGLPQAA
jgi:hypothetical protein